MSWRITGDRETGLAIEDEKGELVCEQVRQHEKLLVAAPEMLEALKDLVRVCDESLYEACHLSVGAQTVHEVARAAVAKAEGRP